MAATGDGAPLSVITVELPFVHSRTVLSDSVTFMQRASALTAPHARTDPARELVRGKITPKYAARLLRRVRNLAKIQTRPDWPVLCTIFKGQYRAGTWGDRCLLPRQSSVAWVLPSSHRSRAGAREQGCCAHPSSHCTATTMTAPMARQIRQAIRILTAVLTRRSSFAPRFAARARCGVTSLSDD